MQRMGTIDRSFSTWFPVCLGHNIPTAESLSRKSCFPPVHLEVQGTYNRIISVVISPSSTLIGSQLGYKYSEKWVTKYREPPSSSGQ